MNCNDKKITRFISERLPKDDSMESVNNYLENKNRIPFPAPHKTTFKKQQLQMCTCARAVERTLVSRDQSQNCFDSGLKLLIPLNSPQTIVRYATL